MELRPGCMRFPYVVRLLHGVLVVPWVVERCSDCSVRAAAHGGEPLLQWSRDFVERS